MSAAVIVPFQNVVASTTLAQWAVGVFTYNAVGMLWWGILFGSTWGPLQFPTKKAQAAMATTERMIFGMSVTTVYAFVSMVVLRAVIAAVLGGAATPFTAFALTLALYAGINTPAFIQGLVWANRNSTLVTIDATGSALVAACMVGAMQWFA